MKLTGYTVWQTWHPKNFSRDKFEMRRGGTRSQRKPSWGASPWDLGGHIRQYIKTICSGVSCATYVQPQNFLVGSIVRIISNKKNDMSDGARRVLVGVSGVLQIQRAVRDRRVWC